VNKIYLMNGIYMLTAQPQTGHFARFPALRVLDEGLESTGTKAIQDLRAGATPCLMGLQRELA
jgi:hypothetical protein